MKAWTRDDYVNLVERAYFGQVAARDLAAVLRCFTPDAVMTVYHGDEPKQVYAAEPGPGQARLADYFEHVFANFDVSYADFRHVVDVAGERTACTFTVFLAPRAGGPKLALDNCNFFACRDGRFADVTIYYANAREVSAPTA